LLPLFVQARNNGDARGDNVRPCKLSARLSVSASLQQHGVSYERRRACTPAAEWLLCYQWSPQKEFFFHRDVNVVAPATKVAIVGGQR